MHKVYLSPSLQEHNKGVGSYGIEMDRMRELALLVKKRLVERGIEVRLPAKAWAYLDPNTSMFKVVSDSNAWGADIHLPMHTNAGGPTADGTMTMYYPGSDKGKKLATAIHKRVAALTPGSDIGIVTSPLFYETKAADAVVAYLELFFHTNKKEVDHYLANKDKYARAIADGILSYFGIPILTPQKTITLPVPDKKPSWWSAMRKWLRLKKKRQQ